MCQCAVHTQSWQCTCTNGKHDGECGCNAVAIRAAEACLCQPRRGPPPDGRRPNEGVALFLRLRSITCTAWCSEKSHIASASDTARAAGPGFGTVLAASFPFLKDQPVVRNGTVAKTVRGGSNILQLGVSHVPKPGARGGAHRRAREIFSQKRRDFRVVRRIRSKPQSLFTPCWVVRHQPQ